MILTFLMILGVGGALGWGLWEMRQRFHRNRVLLPVVNPGTVHPVFDLTRCISSGACVSACPEKNAISMVRGMPKLINPSACVGHGECLRACAVDAVQLVIGSAEKPVLIPNLSEDYQTNLPGVYVAGELAGMGLIHNAAKQGIGAVDAIAKRARMPGGKGEATESFASIIGFTELLIVGAGPAGLAAALRAKELDMTFRWIEQTDLGGSLLHYPRHKLVMTSPLTLPLKGRIPWREARKEQVLTLWHELCGEFRLPLQPGYRLDGIAQDEQAHVIANIVRVKDGQKVQIKTGALLLATGRRGSPRKLGVPGEELPHVVYSLLEPEQYRGKACVVVGGGDTAIETAVTLAESVNSPVALVHRKNEFSAAKLDNQARLLACQQKGLLQVFRNTEVSEIFASHVQLRGAGEHAVAEYIFVCIGSDAPTEWLTQLGISMRRARGEPFRIGA